MITKREYNMERVYSIMSDPEIWERITDDSAELEDFYPPRGIYFSAYCDGELIGIARFDVKNEYLAEYHPMVLKKYRQKYSVEFHDKTIQAIKNVLNGVQLIAIIPSCFKDVIWFARRNGWQLKGKVTHSFKKHDELQDLHIMQYGK